MLLKSINKNVGKVKKALKVLTYGGTNTGKSIFALTHPNIVDIDCEDGHAHYRDDPNIIYYLNTTSFIKVEEVLDEIIANASEMIKEVNTIIIDSETKIYENQQFSAYEISGKRALRNNKSADEAGLTQREWGKIKINAKRLKAKQIKLASLGFNIVSVCQEKEIKVKKGDDYIVIGHRPDGNKGIEHDFDIVIRQQIRKDPKTGVPIYFAEVIKDRTQTYKAGDIIDNVSFENWKHIYESGVQNKITEDYDGVDDIKADEKSFMDVKERFAEEKKKLTSLLKQMDKESTKEVKALIEKHKVDLQNEATLEGLILVVDGARALLT